MYMEKLPSLEDRGDDYDDDNEEKSKLGFLNKQIPLYYLVIVVLVACGACLTIGLGVYFSHSGNQKSTSVNSTKITSIPATPRPTISPQSLRLPPDLQPLEYHLTLKPYLPNTILNFSNSTLYTFDAHVSILFQCKNSRKDIILNGDKLTLNSSTFTLKEASDDRDFIQLGTPGIEYSAETQMFVFNLVSVLKSGRNYTFSINYTGLISDDLKGFYYSKYNENNITKWLAVTQFQPTDARRALPCFDEPAMKAVFYVTIYHTADMHALSNGKEINVTTPGNGWKVTVFEPSKPMSTYLLAFAICSFDYIEAYANTYKHTRFRIWAQPSLIQHTKWAAQCGPKVLEFYEKYFEIDFPLDKQDLLALPELSFGAMENWGLVTFREYALLYDPAIYPADTKEQVASIVAHELAHQWFGDLVTMAWWDDLWLNEGFATWMQYLGADVISNFNFDMRDQFISTNTRVAMSLDQLESSHPVFQPVYFPSEINELFDTISYNKGGSLLNMLNHSMGPENFRKGLHNYLHSHRFGNAKHQDLWDALNNVMTLENNVTGWKNQVLNVSTFMNRWILQMGFPVIHIHWNPSKSSINVYQTRFLIGNNSEDHENPYGYTWYLPVWYYQSANKNGLEWLTPSNTKNNPKVIQDPAFSDQDWILVNPQVYGYYRVNYDSQTWNKLNAQLLKDPKVIDIRSRAQIIDDSMNLAKIPLSLITYLRSDLNYIPWYSATEALEYIGNMLSLTNDYGYYQKFMLNNLLPVYNRIKWDDSATPDNDVLNHKLRTLILDVVCRLEHISCVQNATVLFHSYKLSCANQFSSSSCNRISPNLRNLVYCTAVSSGSSSEWEFLWRMYESEPVANERLSLLYGLSCPKQPWLIIRLLNAVVTGEVRRSEARKLYSFLPKTNQVSTEIIWPYVVQNWERLVDMFGANLFSLRDLISASTSHFNTQSQYDMVTSFVSSHSNLGTAENAFRISLSVIESNIQWMEQHSASVVAWLKQQS